MSKIYNSSSKNPYIDPSHKRELVIKEKYTKRVKKAAESVFQKNVPLTEEKPRRPTIEDSPPCSPDRDLLPQETPPETKAFEEAPRRSTIEASPSCSPSTQIDLNLQETPPETREFNKIRLLCLEAEFASSNEQRVCKTEDVIKLLSKLPESSVYKQEAEYMQAMFQLDLAESQAGMQDQLIGLKTALTLFKTIKDPKHSFFMQAMYWQGYCQCKLALKSELKLREKVFQEALSCFTKVTNPSHLYFQDAQYWQGYCRFKLAQLGASNDKFIRLNQAINNLSEVTDIENFYYSQAKLLKEQCDFEISLLPPPATNFLELR